MKILTTRDAAFFLHREALKRGAKDTRKAFAYAYCDGEKFYSTDGRMMVVSDAEGSAKGWYQPAARVDQWTAAPPSVEFTPPNYKSVIPKPDADHTRLVADLDRRAPRWDEMFFTLQFMTLLRAKGAVRKESRCTLFGFEYIDLLVRAAFAKEWELRIFGGADGYGVATPCLTASPYGDEDQLQVVMMGRSARWEDALALRGAVETHLPGFFAPDPEEENV